MGKTAHEPQHSEHLSDADAMMLRVEKDPQLRSTITAVIVLDGTSGPGRGAGAPRADEPQPCRAVATGW